MLSIVWAKIWCAVDCVAFMKMFAWHCKYHLALGGALYIRGFEIPKRGVNSVGPFEVFDAGLQWPALWSFSSLLAGDLFMKLVTSSLAGQYPNYDGPSSLFPSLSLCAWCRFIPSVVCELPVIQRILKCKSTCIWVLCKVHLQWV